MTAINSPCKVVVKLGNGKKYAFKFAQLREFLNEQRFDNGKIKKKMFKALMPVASKPKHLRRA